MTTTEAQRQRTVHLIRHGEKNPSTAAVDPNQLTETGKRGALAYGTQLHDTTTTLEVYCSTDAKGGPVDRSHDTGWYVHAGFGGLDYAAANKLFRSDSAERAQFSPGLEPLLQQHVPDRIIRAYKADELTRAQAMEECYRMVLRAAGSSEEQEQMIAAALAYQRAAISHARLLPSRSQVSNLGVVLVGHDPNIGCLRQSLVRDVPLKELAPFDGIKIYEDPGMEAVMYECNGHRGVVIDIGFEF